MSSSTCLWRSVLQMAGQPQVLQQPDFNRIQQCHLDLASELNKCRNIPSLDQGAAILNEIRLLREDVNKIHARLSAAYVPRFHLLVFSPRLTTYSGTPTALPDWQIACSSLRMPTFNPSYTSKPISLLTDSQVLLKIFKPLQVRATVS